MKKRLRIRCLSIFGGCNNLTTVYYEGTENQYNQITGKSILASRTKYYYSETQPQSSGNYWHYVNGVPTVWNA